MSNFGSDGGLGRICNLCQAVVWPASVFDHYDALHPGEEWDLVNWPDGEVAFVDPGGWPND